MPISLATARRAQAFTRPSGEHLYSNPSDRGNVLLRGGAYDAAFVDRITRESIRLLPNLMGLAWALSKGDVQLAEQLAQVNSDERRIAFARFLAWQGEAQHVLTQYAKISNVPEEIRRAIIDQLLARGAVAEAFQIWKGTVGKPTAPEIYDGGFEAPLSLTERSFGWRVANGLQATTVSLDSSTPQSGSKNLRVEFNGNSDPNVSLLSQVLLVEPSRRYQINFASRSQGLVTGGPPIVIVLDNSQGPKRLGQSTTAAKGDSDWQLHSFEFTTTSQTRSITLIVQRDCSTSPCPIFGAIWLDSFSLQLLK